MKCTWELVRENIRSIYRPRAILSVTARVIGETSQMYIELLKYFFETSFRALLVSPTPGRSTSTMPGFRKRALQNTCIFCMRGHKNRFFEPKFGTCSITRRISSAKFLDVTADIFTVFPRTSFTAGWKKVSFDAKHVGGKTNKGRNWWHLQQINCTTGAWRQLDKRLWTT